MISYHNSRPRQSEVDEAALYYGSAFTLKHWDKPLEDDFYALCTSLEEVRILETKGYEVEGEIHGSDLAELYG